jgi:hypothetical protein
LPADEPPEPPGSLPPEPALLPAEPPLPATEVPPEPDDEPPLPAVLPPEPPLPAEEPPAPGEVWLVCASSSLEEQADIAEVTETARRTERKIVGR